jgi:hypothetical protein
MILEIIRAALRRRPFSVLVTLALVVLYAALLQVPAPVAVFAWAITALFVLELWLALERIVLGRLGCDEPTPGDRARLEPWLSQLAVQVRVANDPAAWIGSALRTVVISRGALEVLDEPGIFGLLAQAEAQRRSAWLVRSGCVWLGNVPLLAAWWLDRAIGHAGRLLASAIGMSLIVPMLLWPSGFVRWAGRGLGALIVAWLGALLFTGGSTALGLGLLLAWAIVPGLGALLAWEARGMESDADDAVLKAGLGQHLLAGLEQLRSAEAARPAGVLRILVRPEATRPQRLNRLAKLLEDT